MNDDDDDDDGDDGDDDDDDDDDDDEDDDDDADDDVFTSEHMEACSYLLLQGFKAVQSGTCS